MASTTSTIGDKFPTLTRHILLEQQKHKEATGDLTIVLNSIQTACKAITASVRRAGLSNLYGLAGNTNVQGEDVKKLDVIANDNFINALKDTQRVAIMVSEENDEPIICSEFADAKYCVAFDPLDGSSNIDCNVSVGSIFAIYRRELAGTPATVDDIMRPGNQLVCAGYTMYGSSTQLVLTFGEGVHVFTLDPTIGEFLLSHRNVTIPEKPQRIYSCNEGNYSAFPAGFRKFIDYCKTGEKPYSLRYVGSMVADVHRTLLYGGSFAYILQKPGAPIEGKLRLLYECNPMAFIMEQAGGRATTGTTRVLDLVPSKIHQRAPIILGCYRDVDMITKMMAEAGDVPAAGAGAGAAATAGTA